jgi:cytochrome c oxidase subunit 4
MMSDHAADHSADDHAVDIDKHVKVYITVFVALMVLTIITVAVSRVHLPIHYAVTIALTVAIIKGSLVAAYFMHLVSEKKLIYAVMALTVAFFVVLLALPVLTHENGYWLPQPHVDQPQAEGEHK